MSGIIAQNTLDSSGLIKAQAGGGAWNFISKQTASASADISFTSGIDSTYKEYIFTFNNIHPETNLVEFQFNLSADGGSNYNVAKTSTHFISYHVEDDDYAGVGYESGWDLAQSTAFQTLGIDVHSEDDLAISGSLHLFDPSSDVFVKHFISNLNCVIGNDPTYSTQSTAYITGYGNTTSAVDSVQFKMSADAIDAGDICLYGISS